MVLLKILKNNLEYYVYNAIIQFLLLPIQKSLNINRTNPTYKYIHKTLLNPTINIYIYDYIRRKILRKQASKKTFNKNLNLNLNNYYNTMNNTTNNTRKRREAIEKKYMIQYNTPQNTKKQYQSLGTLPPSKAPNGIQTEQALQNLNKPLVTKKTPKYPNWPVEPQKYEPNKIINPF